MNTREFERELFIAIEGYFGGDNWKAKDGRDYTWVMDDLTMNCSDEQWLIVDLTLSMIADELFITGEVPCSTPVSPNEWAHEDWDENVPPYVPPAPKAWWFCIEDMIPRQGTADELMNYTGPFATEREAFIAEIVIMDERIDNLVAEIALLRGKS